jgi:hypothetical protein
MSNHAKVVTFYGICYPPNGEDAARFRGDEDSGEDSLAYIASLYQESRDGVEVVRFGHYDLPGFALAVEGTVESGKDWSPLELDRDTDGPPEGAKKTLKAFCKKHGLTWDNDAPDWWAVPYYG